MKLFISYSHEDSSVADRIGTYFSEHDIDIRRDKDILSVGDEFEADLLNEVKVADGFILLISDESTKSDFVAKELDVAIKQFNMRNDYHIFPLFTERGIKPSVYPQLEAIKHLIWGDISLPGADQTHFEQIAQRCLKEGDSRSDNYASAARALRSQPEYERLEKMMRKVFSDELEGVRNSIDHNSDAILSQNHIITPQKIADREKKVNYDILVISRHLFNDTEDEEIRLSVTENLKRSIKYTYIVVPSTRLDERVIKYHEYHLKGEDRDKGLVSFYVATEDLVMPSSEIVIYDWQDPISAWGYFQLTYGNKLDLNTADLFFKIPPYDISNIVASVTAGIDSNRFKKLEIEDV